MMGFSGCVNEAQIRAEQIGAQIAKMPSNNKDDFIRAFGLPTKCASLTVGEMCEFYRDLGAKGGAMAMPINGVFMMGSNSYRSYELVRVEFDAHGRFVHRWVEVRY